MKTGDIRVPPTDAAGFTLLEAMVALVIVSLGMMAVFMQLDRYASDATRMENKTLASWIATNRITELSIQATWPELGTNGGDVDFAGRRWHRQLTVTGTAVDTIRRVEVSVAPAADPDNFIQTVTGFIEAPPPSGIAPVHWLTTNGPSPPNNNTKGVDEAAPR